MEMKYRPEIDGLRALSVTAVLLYHLGVTWMPGGFTGVDVFFVISGFLITTIIRNDVERGIFSFSDFYARRIRRIFPALIIVLLATSAVGYFILAPGDYAAQGRSAIAAAASISNIFFFLNTGYFDNASETLPLLHTWSLGVEEQFYIVLPILLVAMSRTKIRNFAGTLLALMVILTFIASAWKVGIDQKSAFYLMHYRAWELGIGSLLAYMPTWRARAPTWCAQTAPIVGLGLILYSLLSTHAKGTFPGAGAVPAVIGSALVLAFCGRENLVNRVLSCRPVVQIGKISYSLYLWHWPLIVYWRHYSSGAPLSTSEQFLIGALSILSGWASWRWVETPTRHIRITNKAAITGGLIAMLITAIPAWLIAASGGAPHRIPAEYAAMQSKEVMWQWDCPDNLSLNGMYFCSVGAPWSTSTQKAVVIGDSHAQHMMPLLHEAGRKAGAAIAAVGSCPPIFQPGPGGLRHYDSEFSRRCYDSRRELFTFLETNPDVKTVVIAGLWPMMGYSVYQESSDLAEVTKGLIGGDADARDRSFKRGAQLITTELHSLTSELQKLNVRTIVISDIPTFERDPTPCVLSQATTLLRRKCEGGSEQVTKAQLAKFQLPMAEALREAGLHAPQFQVVVPTDGLCSESNCEAYVDSTYIYRDADHLRRNMPRKVNQALADKIGLTSALRAHSLPVESAISQSAD
ncbi:acyltransferase family protein [Achromobacter kerstersii]